MENSHLPFSAYSHYGFADRNQHGWPRRWPTEPAKLSGFTSKSRPTFGRGGSESISDGGTAGQQAAG